ncbi:hypothetical protein PuT2_14830 [Pusillimonas sp. T2]|uniref:DotH/IcmK family type IV secretion protein n=1 Tax=Pusillimonas sp. T2 TaxID=1548123 RepID=UPI000B9CC543|nr:DotH/IcmK family type IV secretion protein [Pusillimonas sp. T2]OXR48016.1 hypothetical protein PuT2_14830 [Pusillimonas sp. T2]
MKVAVRFAVLGVGVMMHTLSLAQATQSVDNAFLDPNMEKEAWLLAQKQADPAPAENRPADQSANTGASAQRPAQPQGQRPAQSPAYAGNVAQVEPLPTPKLDLKQEVLNQVAPMEPALIREIIVELEKRRQAASTPAATDVKAALSSFNVDLSPGATPPVVRIARGQGAVVTFLDAAGNPWPIQAAENFYSQAMDVKQLSGHVLSVAARSDYLRGSVGVMLEGLATPVTFTVIPAVNATDYRVDLRVPGIAPGAIPQVAGGGMSASVGSADLMAFLYGQTPDGAKRLKVKGNPDVSAWQSASGDLVIRTAAMIASPAWSEKLPSADGTSVYRLPPTPVVLLSRHGKISNVEIQGIVPSPSQAAIGFGQ